jgi:hypothetical protein
MNRNIKFLLITFLFKVILTSCDAVKTDEIIIEEDGAFIYGKIMKDSFNIDGNDTIRILHGKYEFKNYPNQEYSSNVKTVFEKGYVNGKLIFESIDGVYEGNFKSEGAYRFFNEESNYFDVKRAIKKYISEDPFQLEIRNSVYVFGQFGIPVGKHVLKRNDSTMIEMEFDQGLAIGKWKEIKKSNRVDFLEFDSGKLVKEYTLMYDNGVITKKIEGNREYIYENGIETTTLVKVRFNCRNGGAKISVPSDKMWIPLYYEVSTQDPIYVSPKLFPKKASSGSGWLISESYLYPSKSDFQSYKISKQNNRAFYGDGESAVLVDCNRSLEFTAIFLEESK